MAYYALLGGRSIPNLKNFTLEEKIFQALGLIPKRILFVPFASEDILFAIEKFENLVDHAYAVSYLKNVDAATEEFAKADVIYFGGGSIERLLHFVKHSSLESLLQEYQDKDILFMGISAGAILFSKYGMGDQYTYKNANHIHNYKMVEGLGILPITVCPHYDHDGLDCYNDEVKQAGYDGYALEDDTALLFTAEPLVLKQDSRKSVYFFDSAKSFMMIPLYEKKKRELAVLGPKGTYSDKASQSFLGKYSICYFPSIVEVCHRVKDSMDALVPFENTLDGYVMESLDSIMKYDLKIKQQIKLPIQFHFVSYQKSFSDMDSVYVQFKSYGQCQDYLIRHRLTPIFTQSNMESLLLLKENKDQRVGAIIPSHIKTDEFSFVEKDILTNLKNETRFVLISKTMEEEKVEKNYSCSITITPKRDRAGQLFSLLQRFHHYGFNLKSILSRPRRDVIGNYIFYLELDLHQKDISKLYQVKEEIEQLECSTFNILGIYNAYES